MRLLVLRAGLLAVCFLSACVPSTPAPRPIESPTPFTPTATPSATPVWFPPTETPTLMPTPSPRPTEDRRPAVGELLVEDQFSEGGWQVLANEAGRASLGRQELTLAVTGRKGVLTSFRDQALPGDGYLEITVLPSLCSGADAFGIYFRAASPKDGYRLLATCDGRLRLERLKNGELALLQDWTASGEVPRGGLVPLRLGVWGLGADLRIFVNGVYQFAVRDPVWSEGQVAATARTALDGPLTANFSELAFYAIDRSRLPSPTPVPSPTP